jgi:hypothetical protein
MWGTMANVSKFSKLKGAITHGLANMDKWYRKTNNTNAYFICLGKSSFLLDVNLFNDQFQPLTPTGSLCTQRKSGMKKHTMLVMNNLSKQ